MGPLRGHPGSSQGVWRRGRACPRPQGLSPLGEWDAVAGCGTHRHRDTRHRDPIAQTEARVFDFQSRMFLHDTSC